MKRILIATALVAVAANCALADEMSIHQTDMNTYRTKIIMPIEQWFAKECGGDFSSRGGSNPGTLAGVQGLSDAWAEMYPGTKLSCAGGAGTLVKGAASYSFSNGKIVRATEERWVEGVTLEFAKEHSP